MLLPRRPPYRVNEWKWHNLSLWRFLPNFIPKMASLRFLSSSWASMTAKLKNQKERPKDRWYHFHVAMVRFLWCCFAPPSARNLRSSFLGNFIGYPPYYDELSVTFSHFQSLSVIFSHFQSFSNTFSCNILRFCIGFPFGEKSAGFLQVRVPSRIDTEFPYRVRIVDRGVDCRDPVCRHPFQLIPRCRISTENPDARNSGKFILGLQSHICCCKTEANMQQLRLGLRCSLWGQRDFQTWKVPKKQGNNQKIPLHGLHPQQQEEITQHVLPVGGQTRVDLATLALLPVL